MKITVSYFGQLSTITGVKEEEKEINEEANLINLLQELSHLYGDEFQHIVFNQDQLRASNIITKNDELVDKSQSIPLKDGDAIMVHTPIGGG